MWISMLDGFYSVVENADDTSKVVVRARVRGDLLALRRSFVPALGRVFETKHRDYPYRCVVSKVEFAAGLARAVTEGLSYRNYKNAVHERDPRRGQVLARAWSVFRELELLAPKANPPRIGPVAEST